MAAILQICKVTTKAVAASTGVAAQPATDYYFQTTANLYTGDIAANSGIKAEPADEDYSVFPLTAVKELLRAGVIESARVRIEMSDESTYYERNIHYNTDNDAAPDGLIGTKWPVGKPAGGKIIDTLNVRSVVSRR
jgi:hypothetical protein